MRYFILRQSKLLYKPLEVYGLDTSYYKYNMNEADFARLPEYLVSYFKNSADCEIPEIITQPTLMVSADVKKLLLLYDDSLAFKGVQVFSDNIEERFAKSYWTFLPKAADCLHRDCEMLPNGEFPKLILDKTKIPSLDIFKVGNITSNLIILSLPVAESILRRNWFGIALEEIEIR